MKNTNLKDLESKREHIIKKMEELKALELLNNALKNGMKLEKVC